MKAPDRYLVAVLELYHLDAVAVYEHSVEASVVEHAGAARLAVHERVPARDRRVVEAKLGGRAAPDPRPLLYERGYPTRSSSPAR